MSRRRPLFIYLLSQLSLATVVGQAFEERALDRGIDHYALDPTGMAGGVAIIDYDNDGWPDVYLTGGEAADKLYRNRGDGTFTDVSSSTRIAGLAGLRTMGVIAADFDADGYTDLLLTTAADDHCRLLHNEAGQYFSDRSAAAGLQERAWSSSATVADYDADGDLDLYVGNYLAYSALPFEEHITAPEANFLYRNEGGLRFTRVTLPSDDPGCTLATLFSDYNDDGLADLFVLNDFGDFYTPNRLHQNAAGTFSDVSKSTGMRAAMNAMGIASGDLNADGRPDYYVTNIGDNRLYLSQSDGSFREAARQYGLNDGFGMSWGTVLQDFNNDGLLDLFAVKGYLYDQDVAQYNRLYLSRDSLLQLDDHSRDLLVAGVNNKARGAAYGDLNKDGVLDLVVAGVRFRPEHTARTLVYFGVASANNWLKVRLDGDGGNREGIGARLRLYTNQGIQYRQQTIGGSYLSSHSPVLHFGLGPTASVDSLVVDWPLPGGRQVYFPPEVNTTYRLAQDGQLVSSVSVTHQSVTPAYRIFPNPTSGSLYVDLSDAPASAAPLRAVVTTISGQRVSDRQLTPPFLGPLRVAELPPGIYLLTLSGPTSSTTQRVVVH